MSKHIISNDSALPPKKTTNVPNSNQNNISYTQQQIKWRIKSKSELVATSRTNMMKRLTKIVSVVMNHSPLMQQFEMPKAEIRRMFTDVDNAINSWRGVDITSCKKRKKSFKEYKVTATNWFNRNKAKIYGNYFFCPLIFRYVLNYCHGIRHVNMTDNKRMELFISIFLDIFDGKITFARTKAQPLMPYQTLIQPNQFRKKCKELILFYNLEWNQKDISPSKIHRIYQKDKFRSNKIFHSFVSCLKKIQLILQSNNNRYGVFKAENKINYYTDITLKNEPKNSSVSSSVNINRSPVSIAESTDISSINNDEMTNGLSPKMNQLIQSVLNNDNIYNNQNNCPFTPFTNNNINITQIPQLPQFNLQPFNNFNINTNIPSINPLNNINNNIQINNLNVNGNNLLNSNNNNNNGVRVRYQLLSIHPKLPPIVISQNVV